MFEARSKWLEKSSRQLWDLSGECKKKLAYLKSHRDHEFCNIELIERGLKFLEDIDVREVSQKSKRLYSFYANLWKLANVGVAQIMSDEKFVLDTAGKFIEEFLWLNKWSPFSKYLSPLMNSIERYSDFKFIPGHIGRNAANRDNGRFVVSNTTDFRDMVCNLSIAVYDILLSNINMLARVGKITADDYSTIANIVSYIVPQIKVFECWVESFYKRDDLSKSKVSKNISFSTSVVVNMIGSVCEYLKDLDLGEKVLWDYSITYSILKDDVPIRVDFVEYMDIIHKELEYTLQAIRG